MKEKEKGQGQSLASGGGPAPPSSTARRRCPGQSLRLAFPSLLLLSSLFLSSLSAHGALTPLPLPFIPTFPPRPPPRCKLVAHLIYEYPSLDAAAASNADADAGLGAGAGTGAARSKVLDYLKTLPPPAVDLELRALCTHDEDSEGHDLLCFLLQWFAARLSTGLDFELLEAYLHRTLLIHGETIMKQPRLGALLEALKAAQEDTSRRFRGLVQQNLCVLKLVSGLPV